MGFWFMSLTAVVVTSATASTAATKKPNYILKFTLTGGCIIVRCTG